MTDESSALLQRHIIHAREYYENAIIALLAGEAGKAGELLWRCVAQATHAVAAYQNTPLRTHRELKSFIMQLARELNDEDIEKNFIVAESLHHNFYEVQQEPVDIQIVVPSVQNLVGKLFSLLPPQANTQAIPF